MRILGFLSICGFIVIASCSSKKGGGDDCTTDADCVSGDTCIQEATQNGSMCSYSNTQKYCEHPCQADADCAGTKGVLGDTLACGGDCMNTKFCIPKF
jgi:hypothetical protein